jgi:hypothetical protein
MISLRPQALPTPTSAHYLSRENPIDSTSSLSAWYSAGISELIQTTPQISPNRYSVGVSCASITNSYPPLPNEIVHRIFIIAAKDSREACRQLCLVSSWARLLVLPHLMHTVVVTKTNHWLFNSSTQSFPRDDWVFPALFTRNLWINRRLWTETKKLLVSDSLQINFCDVFTLCPNVTSLSATGECLLQMARQDTQKIRRSDITILTILGLFEPLSIRPELQALFAEVTDLTVSVLDSVVDLSGLSQVSNITINYCSMNGEPLQSLLKQLHQYSQLKTIAIGLGGSAMAFGEERLTQEDVVIRARNVDGRIAPPSPPLLIDWLSWEKKMRGCLAITNP